MCSIIASSRAAHGLGAVLLVGLLVFHAGAALYHQFIRSDWGLVDARLGRGRFMIGDTYSIVDMSVWGWARPLPFIFGADTWDRFANVKRLFDEISARPAAERAVALATKYSFKQEMDDAARRVMFPQNARLAAE